MPKSGNFVKSPRCGRPDAWRTPLPLLLMPLSLLLLPIVEIAVFIMVGDRIGVLPTLGLVVANAVIGIILLRRQGLSTLMRIRQEVQAGRSPGRELVHGLMILLAAFLLIVPGLVTDVVGYLLFIPPVRDLAWRFLRGRVTVMAMPGGTGFRRGPAPADMPPRRPPAGVIELDDEEFARRPNPDSPWTGGKPD